MPRLWVTYQWVLSQQGGLESPYNLSIGGDMPMLLVSKTSPQLYRCYRNYEDVGLGSY